MAYLILNFGCRSYFVFWQYHEGVRAMWLAEKGGNIYKHPYDIGAYENLTTVRNLHPFAFLSCISNLFCSASPEILELGKM